MGAERCLVDGGAGRARPQQLDNRTDGRVVRETPSNFRISQLLRLVDERMRRWKQVEDGHRHLAGGTRGSARAPASPRARGRALNPWNMEYARSNAQRGPRHTVRCLVGVCVTRQTRLLRTCLYRRDDKCKKRVNVFLTEQKNISRRRSKLMELFSKYNRICFFRFN